MEINRTNVFEIIRKSGLQPDKDYGQNYLIEPVIANNIVSALNIDDSEEILEIGPGLGSLTHFIPRSSKATLVDIDSRMIDFLRIIYQDTNFRYINNDIRKVDVKNFDKIIGNLPYNITTELVIYLIMESINCKQMILMIQQEAFSRFYDLSGENYGPASILVHLCGEIKKMFVVKPGSFTPSPKCNSLVFSFERKNLVSMSEAVGTYKLAKNIFMSRRKTIFNNLRNIVKNDANLENLLEKLQISKNERPENVSFEKYHKLYLLLNK